MLEHQSLSYPTAQCQSLTLPEAHTATILLLRACAVACGRAAVVPVAGAVTVDVMVARLSSQVLLEGGRSRSRW